MSIIKKISRSKVKNNRTSKTVIKRAFYSYNTALDSLLDWFT